MEQIEQLQNKLKELISLMGFADFSVNYESESSRFVIFISEGELFKKLLPAFVSNLDYLVKLIADKIIEDKTVFVDINNYRRERENLIIELARAAARKTATTKEEVSLPTMNAYERRLVHLELSSHPDVKTESIGEGRERYIVVKPIT
jgi:spoIIIJ-associated protein